jgi:CheY-like chemotaxis protein/HPt (histidine-containing phosphotransfer) domain-containing protein
LTLEPREFLLAELIRSKVIALVSERAREKGLALIVDIEPALQMPLRGDPLRLAQALLNYVANAVKFTAAGQVRLQARRVEAADPQADAWLVRFEVQDSGPGIAPEHQPHIFQPFRQEDGSTYQRFGGSGLGLSITARLAEVMGGEVGLHSEPGQGSCFWITVRLSPATGSRPPVLRPAQDAWRRLQQHAAGRRLLIAEDNPVNRELMLELLDGLGLEIDLAEDGEAAVALGQARHYDLVLMDMQMPRMDGLQATRQLRQLQGWLACPIVAMTANAFEEDRRACIAAGMNDHLAKPIDPPDFYARLERWLALPESGSSPDALPDTLPDAVLFDPERLLQLTRQRPAAVHRILGQFLQHHDGDVSRLRHHIQADEVPQALAVAHALKGAASQVGAVALGGQAAEIEARLRQRRAVDDGALAALELLWPSTREAIERWLAAHPAPPEEVRPGFDPPGRLPLAEPPTDEAP